ncbi:MAG: V-type ATPase 116kDa subunit family protein [Thermoproteus sp.]
MRFAAPPEILIEAIYRLGVAGIAVFEERPQYFAPPPQLELERDIEALRGLLGRFALSATPRPPRGGHLADIIRRYLEALRRCVAEYEPEDVVGREAAKRVVMRCLTEGGISLEEVVGVLNVAEQVIETYKRSAYSEGLDTGKNFTSMAAEIAAKEEEARRMGMLCSFLEWLEREGYSVVRIPRGYRILLEPREEIKEPHQVLELGGFRLAFVAGGREDYGGVEVPREYLLDIGTSRILLRQSIENIKSSIELLKNIAKNMDNIYRNYSAFGDYRWEEHAGTAAIALYVRERDAARLDEILSGVLSGVYVPRGLVGYRAGAVYKLVRTPVSERWPYPIQAFARILYMYGVPGPGEISPLPLVALLFPLFYGWMFGDVGYGLLLLLMSLVLFKMGRKDWAVIWLITAASTIAFGLYYGDFLGLKIWGQAQEAGYMVGVASALVFGYLLMAFAFFLKALQSILSGDVPLALALHVPVLITYLAVGAYLLRYIDVEVYLRGRLLAEQAAYALHALADPYIAAAGPIWLAAGLTALASKYGASHLREIGGEVVLSIIEAFIAATANILSFARLAIIYIAHGIFTSAALSLLALPGGVALYFLAQLLIAGFEGFLTAIQSLRLIYYETLSKFYRGSGRLFEPFRLGESADMRRESAS